MFSPPVDFKRLEHSLLGGRFSDRLLRYQSQKLAIDMSVTMFFVVVNLSDAQLESQHIEVTVSSICLVGVLNADSTFHLGVQRSQNFQVVDGGSAKELRSSLSLSKNMFQVESDN
jgi:hypothetical protein